MTTFTPDDRYQGPPGIMHGGLVTTLADEVAAWAIIGVLENLLDGACSTYFNLAGVKEVAPYVILVVILMIKPYGLFGTKEIERV